MSLEFTKLSEVAVAESISDTANVLIEDGGEVKRTPYSWNTINGRPFGEMPTGGDTLTWDGNTEGLVSATVEVEGTTMEAAYKLSNSVVTIDDFKNGVTVRILSNGEVSQEINLDYEQVQQNFEDVGAPMLQWLVFAPEDNFEFEMYGEMVTCPTAGVYHHSVSFTGGTICEITIPGYTGFPSVVPISESLLPESVKRVVVNVTTADEGATYTADKTFAEITAMLDAGTDVVAKVDLSGAGAEIMYMRPSFSIPGGLVAFSTFVVNELHSLDITVDGVVEVYTTAFSITES